MSTSCLKELQVKYQSRQIEAGTSDIKSYITYQGSYELCSKAMKELQIGQVDSEFGALENIRMSQAEGPFWNIELVYTIETGGGADHHIGGSSNGPERTEINCTMISMPLESKKSYRKNWNYNLYIASTKLGPETDQWGNVIKYVPAWWKTATFEDDHVEKETDYAWGKTRGELPPPPDGAQWIKLKNMTMPGVESYDFPTYSLTESTEYRSKSKAAWMLRHKAQRIAHPLNGDLGLTAKFGGNWLCIGGSVAFNGKKWVVSLSYQYSPDGWNEKLYSEKKE